MSHLGAWEGIEAEGRIRGAKSLFLHTASTDKAKELAAKYSAVWVCKEWILAHGFCAVDSILQWLTDGRFVTLETDNNVWDMLPAILRRHPSPNFRLVADLQAPDWIRTLQPKDAVRLTFSPFNVLTFEMEDAVYTSPSAYDADKPLVTGKGQYRHD